MENETKNILENEATWLRADFHLHTKTNKEFTYTGNDNDLYVEKLKDDIEGEQFKVIIPRPEKQ